MHFVQQIARNTFGGNNVITVSAMSALGLSTPQSVEGNKSWQRWTQYVELRPFSFRGGGINIQGENGYHVG